MRVKFTEEIIKAIEDYAKKHLLTMSQVFMKGGLSETSYYLIKKRGACRLDTIKKLKSIGVVFTDIDLYK